MTAIPASSIKVRGRALRAQKRRALENLYPALKKWSAPKPAPLVPAPVRYWCKRIVLGRDSSGLPFSLDDNSRFLHTHIIIGMCHSFGARPAAGRCMGMARSRRRPRSS